MSSHVIARNSDDERGRDGRVDHWHEAKPIMHGRLGVGAFPDHEWAGNNRRDIPNGDFSLAALSGSTMLVKLNNWVTVCYDDVPVLDQSFTLQRIDVFYFMALLLWTTTELYRDVHSLCDWLESTEPAIVAVFLRVSVFQKQVTPECVAKMRDLARQINIWVLAQKHARDDTHIGSQWMRDLTKSVEKSAQAQVTAALLTVDELRQYSEKVESPLAQLLKTLLTLNFDAALWRTLLSAMIIGKEGTSLPKDGYSGNLPSWLQEELQEFQRTLYRTNQDNKVDSRVRVMSPRCRLMYEVAEKWHAEHLTACARGETRHPDLHTYTLTRWQRLTRREKRDKYMMPYASERDDAAGTKSWKETSKARVCIEDEEDGGGSDAGSLDFGPELFAEDEADDAPDEDGKKVAESSRVVVEDWAFLHDDEQSFDYRVLLEHGTTDVLAFEPKYLRECMRHFLLFRNSWPRPARIRAMSDWPEKLPFLCTDDGHRYASDEVGDLTHRRSVISQLLLIEMGGVLRWMDQPFHPLGDWGLHVRALLIRNRHLVRSTKRPRVNTAAYRRLVLQLRNCHDATAQNDPAKFRTNMGVLCEKVFLEEMSSTAFSDPQSLSQQFGDMLQVARDAAQTAMDDQSLKKVPLTAALLRSQLHTVAAWIQIINELAVKADCIAVVVVDVLCAVVGSCANNFMDVVFDADVCSLACKMKTLAFTDATAPLYYTEYWDAKATGTAMQLEGVSRISCALMPRARFADTPYAQSLKKLVELHALFLKKLFVDTTRNAFNMGDDAKQLLRRPELADEKIASLHKVPALRAALGATIKSNHFGDWKPDEVLFAACAMIKYARTERQVQLRIRKEMKRHVPLCGASRAHSDEIYANLEQAETLLEFVIAVVSSASSGVLVGADDRPYTIIREIKEVREHWNAEDAKYTKQFSNQQREQRKVCKRLMSDCASRGRLRVCSPARASQTRRPRPVCCGRTARAARVSQMSSSGVSAPTIASIATPPSRP